MDAKRRAEIEKTINRLAKADSPRWWHDAKMQFDAEAPGMIRDLLAALDAAEGERDRARQERDTARDLYARLQAESGYCSVEHVMELESERDALKQEVERLRTALAQGRWTGD